jgi:hypothetical protein
MNRPSPECIGSAATMQLLSPFNRTVKDTVESTYRQAPTGHSGAAAWPALAIATAINTKKSFQSFT